MDAKKRASAAGASAAAWASAAAQSASAQSEAAQSASRTEKKSMEAIVTLIKVVVTVIR